MTTKKATTRNFHDHPFTMLDKRYIDLKHLLSPSAQAIYVALAQCVNHGRLESNPTVWPSYSTITEYTGIKDDETISSALAELELAGLIERQRKYNNSSIYTLTFPSKKEIEAIRNFRTPIRNFRVGIPGISDHPIRNFQELTRIINQNNKPEMINKNKGIPLSENIMDNDIDWSNANDTNAVDNAFSVDEKLLDEDSDPSPVPQPPSPNWEDEIDWDDPIELPKPQKPSMMTASEYSKWFKQHPEEG